MDTIHMWVKDIFGQSFSIHQHFITAILNLKDSKCHYDAKNERWNYEGGHLKCQEMATFNQHETLV